jgi:hypothetical protein
MSILLDGLWRGVRLSMAACVAVTLAPTAGFAQDATLVHSRDEASDQTAQPDQQPQEHRRILWIIPNYRTSPSLKDYLPLSPKQKFTVATQDALDPGTFVLAALFAAEGQLTGSAPSFGEGAGAYPRYYITALTDFVVGDFMTEAIFPVMLRQDPRYFRRGTGRGFARLGYAVGQIFWTHTDRGGTQFNLSEIGGNAAAVAIGNAYYPDNRSVSGNASKLAVQIGVDVVSNILKEFAPDLERMLSRSATRAKDETVPR